MARKWGDRAARMALWPTTRARGGRVPLLPSSGACSATENSTSGNESGLLTSHARSCSRPYTDDSAIALSFHLPTSSTCRSFSHLKPSKLRARGRGGVAVVRV